MSRQAEVDPDVVELLCDCHECPPHRGYFTFRVSASWWDEAAEVREYRGEDAADALLSREFRCPRNHLLTWLKVRQTLRVDTHGYSIDPRHPLWQVLMDEHRSRVEAARTAAHDAD